MEFRIRFPCWGWVEQLRAMSVSEQEKSLVSFDPSSPVCQTHSMHTRGGSMRSAILLLLAACANAQSQVNDAASASARLRTLWYQQAYLDGMNEGFSLARRFARSREVRAWFIIKYSNSGYTDQALDSALALSLKFPRPP